VSICLVKDDISCYQLTGVVRYTGGERVRLDAVATEEETKSLLSALEEQVNAVIPNYDFKILPIDPDNHFGLMVCTTLVVLSLCFRFNCITTCRMSPTNNRSIWTA